MNFLLTKKVFHLTNFAVDSKGVPDIRIFFELQYM